jgi:hypothetical protein
MMKPALLCVFMIAACSAPQRPVQFVAPPAPDALGAASRSLAAHGQEVVARDDRAGIIYTSWQDTGFNFGQIDGETATILRRYIITIAQTGGGSQVTLRADTKRCRVGGWTIDNVEVRGRCEQLSELVPQHQQELDTLGNDLRMDLGATPQ